MSGESTEKRTIKLASAPWAGIKGDPAKCDGCPDRYGDARQFCGNAACYDGKVGVFVAAAQKKLKKRYGSVIESDGCDTGFYATEQDVEYTIPVIVSQGDYKGRIYWAQEEKGTNEPQGTHGAEQGKIAQDEPPVAILDAPSVTVAEEPTENETLVMLDPNKIIDSPYQTRRIDPESDDIRELAESIRSNGLIQPLIVRPIGNAGHELIAGHRRIAACRLAGVSPVRCIQRQMNDIDAETALNVENLQRKDLTPLEEADGIVRLLGRGKTPEEVAKMLGVSAKFVYRRRIMARITPVWRAFVEAQKCGPEFIERVARLPAAVADKIFDTASDSPSVRMGNVLSLEAIIAGLERRIEDCPWSARHPEWCADCIKRSDAVKDKDLFGDADPSAQDEEPKCLDPECWKLKTTLFVREQKTELKHEYGAVLTATGTSAYNFAPQKSKTNSVPVIVTDGPSMGAVRWAPPPKPAEEKKAPKLTEPDIRKAAYWEAVASLLKKTKWGGKFGSLKFEPDLPTLAALAVAYGCDRGDTGDECDRSRAEICYEKLMNLSPEKATAALWIAIQPQLNAWGSAKMLVAPGRESERELRYKEALALEKILNLDPEETERASGLIYRRLYAETLKSKKGSEK